MRRSPHPPPPALRRPSQPRLMLGHMPDSQTEAEQVGPWHEGLDPLSMAAKVETSFSRLREPHFSQGGFLSPVTSASNAAPHFLHRYS